MARKVIELVDAALLGLPDRAADLARDRITNARKKVRIGIVTALPLEAAAVSAALGGDQIELPIARRATHVSYTVHLFRSALDGAEISVVVALANQMGNNAAAVTAASLLMDFPAVQDLLVVGIAGGIPLPDSPSRHVRLGDIVVGLEGVVQYDFRKVEIGHSELRKAPPAPSARLTNAVQRIRVAEERGTRLWEPFLSGAQGLRPRTDQLADPAVAHGVRRWIPHPRQSERRAGYPLVHYGLIGSANILLKDHVERDRLAREYKLQAVEMEGSGIADAAWNFACGYIAIRAVCDYCDMNKNKKWQRYAAASAAAYARAIVEQAMSDTPMYRLAAPISPP